MNLYHLGFGLIGLAAMLAALGGPVSTLFAGKGLSEAESQAILSRIVVVKAHITGVNAITYELDGIPYAYDYPALNHDNRFVEQFRDSEVGDMIDIKIDPVEPKWPWRGLPSSGHGGIIVYTLMIVGAVFAGFGGLGCLSTEFERRRLKRNVDDEPHGPADDAR